MERITILDFASGKVFIREVPEDMIEKDAEDVFAYYAGALGLRESDCTYMISNDDDFIDSTITFTKKKIKVTHLGEDYSAIQIGRLEFEASLGLGEALLKALK